MPSFPFFVFVFVFDKINSLLFLKLREREKGWGEG